MVVQLILILLLNPDLLSAIAITKHFLELDLLRTARVRLPQDVISRLSIVI